MKLFGLLAALIPFCAFAQMPGRGIIPGIIQEQSGGLDLASLRTGLVAYWPLENSANWEDLSGLGHTLTNAAAGGLTNAIGILTNGAGNSGATKWIACPDSDDFSAIGSNSITITGWYKVAYTNSNSCLISKDASGSNREWQILQTTSGGMDFGVFTNGSGSSTVYAKCPDKIVANAWNFVAAQIDSTNLIARIRVATTNAMGQWYNSVSLAPFGKANQGTNTTAHVRICNLLETYYFNGIVDEVTVHRRLLTDQEITNQWSAIKIGVRP